MRRILFIILFSCAFTLSSADTASLPDNVVEFNAFCDLVGTLGVTYNPTCLNIDPCVQRPVNGNIDVHCGNNNETIVKFLFNSFNGIKLLPNLLSNFTNLTEITTTGKLFGGSIPSEIGSLTKLSILHLPRNELNGTLPTQLGNLRSLTVLNVDTNIFIEGTIPTHLGNMRNIEYLNIYNNQIEGTIPTQIGILNRLTVLDIGANLLTGTIPTQLGKLTRLLYLDIGKTHLNASSLLLTNITDKIEVLYIDVLKVDDSLLLGIIEKFPNLQTLALGKNNITSIPTEIGKLTSLRELNLEQNNLSGTLPSELANLTKLNSLIFDGNLICYQPTSDLKNSAYDWSKCIPNTNNQTNPANVSELSGNVVFDRYEVEIGNKLIGKNMNMTTNTLILSQNSNLVLQNSTIKATNISISSLNLTISSNQNSDKPIISATECLNISPNSELNVTFENTTQQQNQTIFSFKCKTGSFSKIRVNGNECNYELKNTYLSVLPNKDCEQNQPNRPNPNTGEQKAIFSITLGVLLSIFFIL